MVDAEVVRAGEFDSELLEAIALLAGVYGGAVFLPASFQGVEVRAVREDLVKLLGPARIEVSHLAKYTTVNNGSRLYEGFGFIHQTCEATIKLRRRGLVIVGEGERPVPSEPGEGL